MENERQLLPCALIGAALAKGELKVDGKYGLGAPLAACYNDTSDQGSLRIRRLLACDSSREACRRLRPLLALFQALEKPMLSHARLLADLLQFDYAPDRVRRRWAMDFYGNMDDKSSAYAREETKEAQE